MHPDASVARRKTSCRAHPPRRGAQADGCTEKYMRFGMEDGRSIIMEREQVVADTPTILLQHAIAFDRSVDLRSEAAVVERPPGGTPATTGTHLSTQGNGTRQVCWPASTEAVAPSVPFAYRPPSRGHQFCCGWVGGPAAPDLALAARSSHHLCDGMCGTVVWAGVPRAWMLGIAHRRVFSRALAACVRRTEQLPS
jgi:PDZ domain